MRFLFFLFGAVISTLGIYFDLRDIPNEPRPFVLFLLYVALVYMIGYTLYFLYKIAELYYDGKETL